MILHWNQNWSNTLILILLLYKTNLASPDPDVSQESSTITPDIPIRYIRGVYEVPEAPNQIPVIYDSYFPIFYEFHLPKWDASTMKIQFWKDHNNCTESDTYSSGYPCPVIFHMNTLIDNFVGNMTLWKNLFLDDPHPSLNSDDLEINPDLELPLLYSQNKSQILDTEYYCNKIVQHFATFQTTRPKLEEYYKLFENCENEVVKIKVNLTSLAPNLEKLYHDTFTSFVTDYWDLIPNATTKQALALNLWTTLETTLLLHQFMETQKWSQAIESCEQYQIPWTLIDHDSISSAIQHNLLHEEEHHLAIPLSQMSKYFKLPLTDCVFLEKDTLVVRVLIPWRNYNMNKTASDFTSDIKNPPNPYKIIKFEPVIFHQDGEFCWIDGIRGQRFISDNKGGLYTTECSDQEQNLCKTSTHHYSSHDAADPCAQALYNDEEDQILEICFLKCVPFDRRYYTHKYFNFAHTSEDNFIIAVADDEIKINVGCNANSEKTYNPVNLTRMEYGAWNLTLPCGCELKMTEKAKTTSLMHFEIAKPCHDTFILEKIRPYHWRKGGNMENVRNSSDSDRNSNPGKLGFATNAEISDEDYFIQQLDKRYGSYTMHYVLLWIVVMGLTIVVGVLGWMVVQLRYWRQQEAYKESRLIYNVRDSGDDFSMERPPTGF